jgi:hypothetical protein
MNSDQGFEQDDAAKPQGMSQPGRRDIPCSTLQSECPSRGKRGVALGEIKRKNILYIPESSDTTARVPYGKNGGPKVVCLSYRFFDQNGPVNERKTLAIHG